MTTQTRRWIVCACCGEQGWHIGHGWRDACWRRWIEAGKPADGPPPPKPGSGGVLKSREIVASRLEDLALLLDVGVDKREAARRIGVSYKTVCRYERRLAQTDSREMSNA